MGARPADSKDAKGSELLEDIRAAFNRFLALPDGGDVTCSLWVMFAHTLDAHEHSPRLLFWSAAPGCGKTTALGLLNYLCPNPLSSSNATPATIFRFIDKERPTFLLDEADAYMGSTMNDELISILNSGHHQDQAFTLRTVGDNHEPKKFSTWCPMAVAVKGRRVPSALASRCIRVTMDRVKHGEQPPRFVPRVHKGELEALRQRCEAWAEELAQTCPNVDPPMPGWLQSRDADNWRPLFTIAYAAGGPWPERAQRAAETLLDRPLEDEDLGIRLLRDVHSVFARLETERLHSDRLCVELAADEEAPWGTINNGGRINKRKLATMLARFSIRPTPHPWKEGPKRGRGYEQGFFADAWARYTPEILRGHRCEAA